MKNYMPKPLFLDGEIICEEKAIDGLFDGNVYVVCNHTDMFVDAISNALAKLFSMMDNSMLFYKYDIVVIDDFSQFAESGKLFNAVKERANVIIPLCTPNISEKQYLANNIKHNEIDLYLPSMILKAENISKSAIEDALMQLAMIEPNACEKILDSILPNDENLKSTLQCYLLFPPTGELAVAPLAGGTSDGSIGPISYQQSREIFSRFVVNCNTLKKAEKKIKFSAQFQKELDKAKCEIDHVFNTIWGANKNMDSLRKIIINQSDKKISESYDNFFNKEKMANESNISIVIEKSAEGRDKHMKNNGYYRVYADDGKNKIQIHFTRKPSCIIYMMYLMDKQKRGEDVDFLKISKNKEIFCKLYTQVYDGLEVEDVFNGLTSKIRKGEARKARLTDCYLDIHKSLTTVINDLGEEVPPFVIPNEYSHLAIRTEKIIVASEFDDFCFLY